jgi:hypothetical protein
MQQISPGVDFEEHPALPNSECTPHPWLDALMEGGPATVIADYGGKLLYANSAYRVLARSIDLSRQGEIGEPAILPPNLLVRVLNGEGPLEDTQQYRSGQSTITMRGRVSTTSPVSYPIGCGKLTVNSLSAMYPLGSPTFLAYRDRS